jgi:UDP-N-acetylmuramyl tripeptide synthase
MATPTSLPASFTSGQVLTAAQMNSLRGAFRILQVVSTSKTDTFSSSLAQGASAAITGLSASITPTSTSSKILVSVNVTGALELFSVLSFIVKRDGTAIGVGATAGSRTSVSATMQAWTSNGRAIAGASSQYLDSPASTSALSYTVEVVNVSDVTRTAYINRTQVDTDNSSYPRGISTITVMEVSA